jgi:predicted permease
MPGVAPDVTIPLEAMPARTLESRASLWIRVTGRLRDGVNPEQAKAALAAPWAELLRATVPTGSPGPRRDAYFAMGLELLPAAQGAARGLGTAWRRPLELLLSACGLMLVLAALNLATLALARAVARGHELGVRAALGAGHWALGRRVLVENAVLAVCGAVLALGVTEWGGRVLAGLLSASEPALVDARPDWRVAGYALGAALVAAVLMSLAPLWRVACIDLPGGLREGGRGGQRGLGRSGQALVVMQMALTVVLVAGAGLLARTLYGLSTLDLGFERRGLLELGLAPQGRGYEGIDINTYTRELLERVGRTNGVRAAALTDGPVPMGRDGGWRETVVLNGRESLATLRVVTPGFFRTLGVALESGRDFDWDDDARRPARAIVDARLAARLAAGGGLIGRRVRFGVQPEFQALEVVGVARPARLVDLRDDGAALIYVPAAQHADWAVPGVLMVRGGRAGDVETTVRGLGREFVARVRSLEQASAATLVEERTIALLAALFAALSVGLAATGLFGLISYSTTRRRRELGIRLALGCERGRMMTLILSDTLRLAVAGLALGVPAALIAGRLMGHLLHGVAWYDPPTLAATALLLVGVGLMAGYLPARRAARLDPSRALRAE